MLDYEGKYIQGGGEMVGEGHVRVVRGTIQPGELDRLLKSLDETIVPRIRQEADGFTGAELWVDDEGTRCELTLRFAHNPCLVAADELYEDLLGKTLAAGVSVVVQEFTRLRVRYATD